MTDKSHLEDFTKTISDVLSQKLVVKFVECHRDPTLSEADVTTLLKEQMEAALAGDKDAAPQAHHQKLQGLWPFDRNNRSEWRSCSLLRAERSWKTSLSEAIEWLFSALWRTSSRAPNALCKIAGQSFCLCL